MYKSFIIVLVLCIIYVNAYEEDENDHGFIDVGVRLTGDNSDSLIADLIAEEKNILHAGHVRKIIVVKINC